MVYKVIGLMSGSSLDGLDIVFTYLTEVKGKWSFAIEHADCIPYNNIWKNKLKNAASLSVPEYLRLHTAYGNYIAQCVNDFINKYDLVHKVDFIVSHGHTVWHEPMAHTSTQIGDGAAIATATRLQVISDLRNIDVALGGQGAPIVPIADKYLLKDYDFCLNIGGIANITINGNEPVAFDICPANQLLNHFAQKLGLEYDEEGKIAAKGALHNDSFNLLCNNEYYTRKAPKSLHNGFVYETVLPCIAEDISIEDKLNSATKFIARKIKEAVLPFKNDTEQKMLITGGGAFNTYLLDCISNELSETNIQIFVPEDDVVNYKEALAMALIGTLRWREEVNVLSSVTGAERDSVGGALWLY